MTKQTEALRMAIEALDWELGGEPLPTLMIEARKACKKALEQPADGIELEWYCKGWDDAEKDLVAQEPKSPTMLARLPNGTTASNVYEAYEAGLKEGKAETQEPFGIWHFGNTEEESDFFLYKDSGDISCENCIKLYTTPPSREWQSLSDDEVQKVLKEMWDKGAIPSYSIVKFALAIEAKLREKNG